MSDRLAVALPVGVLLTMVCVHTWLVQTQSLSPWLSAGFGMFSTYDGPGNREVRLTAESEGAEWPIDLLQGVGSTAYRYAALPGGDRLARFVEHLTRQGHPGLEGASSVRVEVWQRNVSGRPLVPNVRLLRSYRTDLSPGEN